MTLDVSQEDLVFILFWKYHDVSRSYDAFLQIEMADLCPRNYLCPTLNDNNLIQQPWFELIDIAY